MLCLEFKGAGNIKEKTLDATIENTETVTEFVDQQLEEFGCTIKAQNQIDIAIDELFSNIARYAYYPNVGKATVRVEVNENPISVTITFIDDGVPFDPLEKADPDITMSADERENGGLGIYLVKKSMDSVSYEYKNGKNILTIRKNCENGAAKK